MDGAELRTRRDALGLSLCHLGERLGVDRMTAWHWERGRYPVPPCLHLALAQIERQATQTAEKEAR